MFKFTPPPPAIKSAVIATTLALSAFSINAHATLTSYTANGKGLVYSSVSNVTWTKDGNLLGTMFANQGFNTVVNAIIAASPTITNTPNYYSPSGTYSLSARDFGSNGLTTWFGAMGYVNYLNSINYGGSNDWRLPTVTDIGKPGWEYGYNGNDGGYNSYTNNNVAGNELTELYYQELGNMGELGTDGKYQRNFRIKNLATFDNVQLTFMGYAALYWSGTELTSYPSTSPDTAWTFDFYNGYSTTAYKYGSTILDKYFAWAVSPGQVAAVPEPEFGAMLLLGLGVVGFASRRKTKTA